MRIILSFIGSGVGDGHFGHRSREFPLRRRKELPNADTQSQAQGAERSQRRICTPRFEAAQVRTFHAATVSDLLYRKPPLATQRPKTRRDVCHGLRRQSLQFEAFIHPPHSGKQTISSLWRP